LSVRRTASSEIALTTRRTISSVASNCMVHLLVAPSSVPQAVTSSGASSSIGAAEATRALPLIRWSERSQLLQQLQHVCIGPVLGDLTTSHSQRVGTGEAHQ
jgi:hypothetical protein